MSSISCFKIRFNLLLKKLSINPGLTYGKVVSKEDFCKRPELMKKLAVEIKRGQNVYLQGEQRTGNGSKMVEVTTFLI